MIEINPLGRFGNILLQNCVASILSKKFDIKVNLYHYEDCFSILKPKFNIGNKEYNTKINIFNNNLIETIEKENLQDGLFLNDYFQFKEFVLKYRKDIVNIFDRKKQNLENDLFVHVRLGDTSHLNVGLDYYRKAISCLNFKKGYISSDSEDHPIVLTLIKEFKLISYKNSPIETINYGKMFKNIILSGGSFSWWIGLLSNAENIIYPKEQKNTWYGDIFVFDDWKNIIIN